METGGSQGFSSDEFSWHAVPVTDTPPRRPGRPPAENPRSVRIDVPLTPDERDTITAAAQASGATPTAYVRDAALRAARRARSTS